MSIGAGLVILPIGIVLTVLVLAMVRRLPAARNLRENSELSGMYVTAIAAVYAVLLGFMVLAVWTRFDQAEARTEEEAATVGTVARLAHSLPLDQGQPVLRACRIYAEQVQTDEWAAMTEGRESTSTHQALDGLWGSVLRLQFTAQKDGPVVSEAIDRMTELSRLRRLRLLAARSGIPTLLWCVLLAGAIVTVGAPLLLWTESFRVHAAQAAMLWLVIGLALLATAELSGPFQGDVHVDSHIFTESLDQVKDMMPERK